VTDQGFVLVQVKPDQTEDVQRALEDAGIFIVGWCYDPKIKQMNLTVPAGVSPGRFQRAAMRAGYRPPYITFRGAL
jgi:hypothetical protein